MLYNFKYFAGPAAKDGSILVRSDAAKELTGAVSSVGWHAEASLENRWPHNSHPAGHETKWFPGRRVGHSGALC